jgi:uroporphyrinogen-III synthase
MTTVLAGVSVLVTRPEPQGRRLAEMISGLGGKPILFPAIDIELLAETQIVDGLRKFEGFDLVVFVSPNAVRAAMPAIGRVGGMPGQMRVAAMGPGTADGLRRAGVGGIIVAASGFDSEALLAKLRECAPPPKRVLVIRGEGGREWLGDSLSAGGAQVEYLECYRRVRPRRRFSDLSSEWGAGGRMACVATSAEIVANLFAMAGDEYSEQLRQMPFFVPHPRVATAAFRSAVKRIIVAGNGDASLAQGLSTWYGRLRTALPVE